MELVTIFHCNEWKEYSSFKFIGVVSEEELDSALLEIQKECNYTLEDMETYIALIHSDLGELDI